jgi:hypothetical protein
MRHACGWLVLSVLLLQACHGTSIVWVVAQAGDYVVLAADSRTFSVRRQQSSDHVCKVIALDRTIFFTSGTARIELLRGTPWDSLQTAQEIYKATEDHDAQALSIAWGNRTETWFERQSPSDNQSAMWPNGGLVNGGFINFASNRDPTVFVQSLLFNAVTSQISMQTTSYMRGDVGVAGVEVELFTEFTEAKTSRALKAYGKLKPHGYGRTLSYDRAFVKKAVQFVIDNVSETDKQFVHGPIDVVVLRRFGGIDWVARKPNCYSQDLQRPQK